MVHEIWHSGDTLSVEKTWYRTVRIRGTRDRASIPAQSPCHPMPAILDLAKTQDFKA
jgi:hypothetical protein